MTLEVVLLEEARRDLADIGQWVADRADRDVARRYVDRIEAFCGRLNDFPRRGTPRDDLQPGLRSVSFERRLAIFYRIAPDAVEIVNIVHQARDAARAISINN